jgi:ornithine carbamoyltransferase
MSAMPAPAATVTSLRGRDLLRMDDLSAAEIGAVLDLAAELKAERARGGVHHLLPGASVGLVFEKPSTRTRVSFEVGVHELGGHALHLDSGSLQLRRGEPVRDTGLVLARYLDAIVIRALSHRTVDELADASSVPVVNGLTDLHHPCQALADLLTLRERLGSLAGRRLAWVGDADNNVCRSLIVAAAAMGMSVVVASPRGYEPDAPSVAACAGRAAVVVDPREAAAGADALVTDVWTSMGQEDEAERRRRDLAAYRVDAALVALTDPDAVVLHCLPARVGEEITEDVLYGPRAAVWDEAENRLHAQKALLALLVAPRGT